VFTLHIRKPMPILAKGGEVFIVCVGRTEDASYCEDLRSLEEKLLSVGDSFKFSGWQKNNTRGAYKSISTGVTHGGGSKVSSVNLY
jgi:hypothetical protein